MGFMTILTDVNIVGFLLLFFRFAALFIAVPIFSHNAIPMTVKSAMAFVFTVVFYASMPPINFEINLTNILLAAFSEILFGVVIGLVLQLAFNVISFGAGLITFTMGFSLANTLDPETGPSSQVVNQFLSLMGIMVLFSLNLHHWMLLFIDRSLQHIPLGGFIMSKSLFTYMLQASANLFFVGFTIAFPIIALSWMSDLIFGMLMKTMPQFNLLAVGIPFKIIITFIVLMAVFASSMLILQAQMQDAVHYLETLF
jgi:flagellar biosynthesis protein FliR